MRVVVLGGGVAGEAFLAALRREAPDAEITLVERELVGGECSYWACIPSKTMLRPVELAFRSRVVPGSSADLDLAQLLAWRDEVAGKNDASQAQWVADQGAALIRGAAEISEPGLVRVDGREIPYDHLAVATGSLPAPPPIDGLAEAGAWTSREGTSATELPESLVVVGGGAVGCELAQFYARAGSRVTLVQAPATLLDRIDAEAGELLAGALSADGVDVRTSTRPDTLERANGRLRLSCGGEQPGEVEGTHLLVATGRRPNVDGFGLDRLPVTVERQGLRVDGRLNAGENVWAAGDVTGVALFTHVGKYQGRVAAANVAGGEARADYRAVPAVVFTDPQIAAVGRTDDPNAATARWSIESVSRASTYAKPKPPGFVKLYADRERGVLTGAVAVGPEAGEWLGQLTLAVRAEIPVEILRDTMQPFPTFSEAIYFAARELDL